MLIGVEEGKFGWGTRVSWGLPSGCVKRWIILGDGVRALHAFIDGGLPDEKTWTRHIV